MGDQAQAHLPDSTSMDTLNARVVPVILVPGVMGSRLDITDTGFNWDPDSTTKMAGWRLGSRRSNVERLNIATSATVERSVDSTAASEIAVQPLLRQFAVARTRGRIDSRAIRSLAIQLCENRGWGGVAWSYYGAILMDLVNGLHVGPQSQERHPVYVCGYDWRQSNADSARSLIRRIDQALAENPLAKRVVIVTHSMGGLVTRAALLQGAEPRILGVLHTMIPADGAVIAYRRFLTGAQKPYEAADADANFLAILGRSPLHYSVMQSVLRGPTELLPHDVYPEIFFKLGAGITNKFFSDIFAEYARDRPPGVVFRAGQVDESETLDLEITANDVTNMRARLREAGLFTRTIALRFHSQTFLLFGNERLTDVEFDWNSGTASFDGKQMEKMVILRKDGDGTVPTASSRADGCGALGSTAERPQGNLEHGGCFAVARFRKEAVERVQRILALR